MAWDEWEQLKSYAVERQSGQMQLNQLDPGSGGAAPPAPSRYGDLKASQGDLANIGKHAFELYNQLWDKGRAAMPSSGKAAGDLSTQGFALGSGLQHVVDALGRAVVLPP